MDYIVLDMEWNQPSGSTKMVTSPVFFHSEIIQIGAVKLNKDFELTDTFKTFVRPKFYPKMHKRISRLTGITDENLTLGIPFENALDLFKKWCGEDFAIFTWGKDDIKILNLNMEMFGSNKSWLGETYDLQLIFDNQVTQNHKQISLSKAMEIVNEPALDAHDALNDAKNTAVLCKHLDLACGVEHYNELKKLLLNCGDYLSVFQSEEKCKDVEKALSDPKYSTFCCPKCGQICQDSGLILQKSSKYLATAHCNCGAEYLVKFKAKAVENDYFDITRLLYEMDEKLKELYERKKNPANRSEKSHTMPLTKEEINNGVLEKKQSGKAFANKIEMLNFQRFHTFTCPDCGGEVVFKKYLKISKTRGESSGVCNCSREFLARFGEVRCRDGRILTVRRVYEMTPERKKKHTNSIKFHGKNKKKAFQTV